MNVMVLIHVLLALVGFDADPGRLLRASGMEHIAAASCAAPQSGTSAAGERPARK